MNIGCQKRNREERAKSDFNGCICKIRESKEKHILGREMCERTSKRSNYTSVCMCAGN